MGDRSTMTLSSISRLGKTLRGQQKRRTKTRKDPTGATEKENNSEDIHGVLP